MKAKKEHHVAILIQEEFNGPYEVYTNIPNFKLKTLNPLKDLSDMESDNNYTLNFK